VGTIGGHGVPFRTRHATGRAGQVVGRGL